MMEKLLVDISKRLAGMNVDDMTTAERQITNLLISGQFLQKNLDGEVSIVYNSGREERVS